MARAMFFSPLLKKYLPKLLPVEDFMCNFAAL